MTDVHSSSIRSYNMRMIKGKNTKPELLVRSFLFAKGYRYRLHLRNLPGKPDIVFSGIKTVIFINGCFWHGHKNCKYFIMPKTRTEWWKNKIDKNKDNDKTATMKLRKMGWQVISIFECQLKSTKKQATLDRLNKQILSIKGNAHE